VLSILLSSYTLLDLHIPPSSAVLNDSGVIAGKMYAESGMYACFVWKDGKLERLAPEIEEVRGINSKGQVAVQTAKGSGVWANGKYQLVGEDLRTAAFAGIDDQGQMIGEIGAGSEGVYSVVYSWKPKPSSFGPGGPRPAAVAPDGAYVGNYGGGRSLLPPTRPMGWLRTEDKEIPIGDVDHQTEPTCISRNHHVGGTFSYKGSFESKPFIWFNGKLQELPIPGEQSYGKVVGVNDQGEAIGEAHWKVRTGEDLAYRDAIMYWKNGKYFFLKDLLPKNEEVEIIEAFAINNKGQILVHISPTKTHWIRSLAILTPKT